jgi:hypothetical protein
MLSKKGIDEFAFVLIAGLIFISIMLITWGTGPTPEENITENITVTPTVSIVGLYTQDIPKQYWIGEFKVSYGVGSEILFSKKDFTLKKGLFESKPMRVTVKIDPEKFSFVNSGFLVINIEDTNMAGDLIIYINNQRIRSVKPTLGEISIPVKKEYLKEDNVIEIKAGSPGWKFWVTTIYKIAEIKFGINIYGVQEKVSSFDVTKSQIENFKLARLEFELHDYNAAGDLIVKINNNIIYEGIPQKFFSMDFSLEDLGLVEGTNTISFSTELDAFYEIDDARLTIIHTSKGYKSISKKFSLSESDYNKLREGGVGLIKFNIQRIEKPGTLQISIIDSRGYKHEIIFQQFSTGLNKVRFDKNSVKPGTNMVTFSSTDGTFYISDIKVVVA